MKLAEQKSKSAFFARKPLLMMVLGIATLALSAFLVLQPTSGVYSRNVLVLGHAGSGFFSPINPFNALPSNSMASIAKAMEEDNADGVEVDVHVSLDGVPVLYHDRSLESMSEGTGLIEQLPAAEVVGLRYNGGWFYNLFHSEKIITMEEMLQRFQTYPEPPYLHIDVRNYDESRHAFYAQAVMGLLRRYEYPLEKVVLIYPGADLLYTILEMEPEAIAMLDSGDDFDISMQEALAHNLPGIVANGKRVTGEQVRRAKEQGLQVYLFGGKSGSGIARLLKMEPDGIQVNNVKRMRSLLGRD